MTDRSKPTNTESVQQSKSSRETIAPSGLDSAPTGSGLFDSLPAAFGRFEVRKLLGAGAMGKVYLAFDPEMQREVALKIPKFEAADEPILLERFWREARATGAMNHDNICGMYEVGEIGGTHFISMEYVDGCPLAEYIGSDQPQRQVAAIVRKLAQGLAHAHERGFIHRDLKPSNVMVATDGQPKIMDFGLARRFGVTGDIRLTQSNTIVGSPAYMSPEQARSENDTLTPASDIYSLGTLFFELLTGELPFKGPMAIVLGMIAMGKVPKPSTIRPDIDPGLESLCLKMLEKKRDVRPQSMTEVANSLTEWLKGRDSSPEIEVSPESGRAGSTGLVDDRLDRSAAGRTGLTSTAPLAPKQPATPPTSKKADFLTEQQQRVTDLLDKHQYGSAIELLEKMINLRDARFEKLVAWAKPKLKEVRATEQKLREASAPSCDTAQQLLKHYDYTGAAELLAQVPPAYRSIELRDLLEKVTDLRDECDHLQRDIEAAVRTGDIETLPALVKRLYKLKPNNKAIKQLAADVKQHGAKKVIALRKGQRRFLDPAGRIIEPSQIVLGVIAVVLIFVAVSLIVRNYLAKKTPPPPPPVTSPPGKSSVTPKPDPHGGAAGGTGADPKGVEPTIQPPDVTSTFTGMKLTLIPKGTFTMGSPDTEAQRGSDEGPQHTVQISRPFYMGIYEVTQGEYQQVMGTNPSSFKTVAGQDTNQFPVEMVSWFDAIDFCNRLSLSEKLAPYYTLTAVTRNDALSIKMAYVAVAGGDGYRLPTEAEWEYACRAGTTTPLHFGNTLNGDRANVNGHFPYGTTTKGLDLLRTTTVGSYSKNAFGLFDVHGNAWEWCFDYYDEKYYSQFARQPAIDPTGPATSTDNRRVVRSGCWDYYSWAGRSAFRNSDPPDARKHGNGFRVVRSVAPTATVGSAASPPTNTNGTGAASGTQDMTVKPSEGSPVTPFEIPTNGLKGRQRLAAITPPQAWRQPGVFASITGSGELRFPSLPATSYVLDTEIEMSRKEDRIIFRFLGVDLSLGDVWPEHKKGQGLLCHLFWARAGTVFWNGHREFKLNERVKLRLVVVNQKQVLLLDGRPILYGSGWPADLDFQVTATGPTSKGVIHRCEIREVREDDVRSLGWKIPEWTVRSNVAQTADLLKSRDTLLGNRPEEGKAFVLPESNISMKWIKAGEFEMGSADPKKKDSEPAHRVKLSRGYWMASYETTQTQFRNVRGADASRFNGSPHLPVDYVSHHDASVYCERLTASERKAGRLPSDYVYRLPTEAEWEYACRAGSSNDFSVPEAKFWHSGTSQEQTHEVGTSEPNAWGLYDMSGNVWEWCYDSFGPYFKSEPPPMNPVFLSKNSGNYVIRGGAWWTAAQDCRSTRRDQSAGEGFVGFRVVLGPAFRPGFGLWQHLNERHVLLADGKIDTRDSKDTWSITGRTLILKWKRANAPNGFWIDKCNLSADGQSYTGRNQRGEQITGRKLPDY